MADHNQVLYLFDVDGTLTAPRRPIEPETWRFLLQDVATRGRIGVVSGSDWDKVCEQLGGAAAARLLPHVYCENGLVEFAHGERVGARSMLEALGEPLVQRVINWALAHMARLQLPAKRGNFVEFRTGMLNLCPVGRSCSQAEREVFAAYDREHGIRQAMAEKMRQEFEGCGLTVALGGQISVDVFPSGWDKTYCLQLLQPHNYAEIHFFGDKTEPGGNDHEIYTHPQTIGHAVTSPQHTVITLKRLLNIDECSEQC